MHFLLSHLPSSIQGHPRQSGTSPRALVWLLVLFPSWVKSPISRCWHGDTAQALFQNRLKFISQIHLTPEADVALDPSPTEEVRSREWNFPLFLTFWRTNHLKLTSAHVLCLVCQSCLTLCDAMDCSPPGSSVHGDSPGKSARVGCHALLQGIFPSQGSKPGHPHCRKILYHLSQQGIYYSCSLYMLN